MPIQSSVLSRIGPLWRPGWALPILAGLLIAELAWLSVRFDTAVLAGDTAWSSQLIGGIPALLRIGLAAMAAFVLMTYGRWGELTARLWRDVDAGTGRRWLTLHLFAFAAFYLATLAIFETAALGVFPTGGSLAGWLMLGGGMGVLWLLAVASPRGWRAVIVGERWALLWSVMAGCAAWGIGEIAHEFWKPLAAGTFWLSEHLLGLMYADIVYDPASYILGTSRFQVSIAPACSGYEGIGLITVFLAIYIGLFRRQLRFPAVWWLLPIGALVIWLTNSLRIAALIALGTSYSREVAEGGFHSQAGWIAFVVVALGMVALTRHRGWFVRVQAGPAPQIDSTAAALLVPLLAMLAGLMLSSALSQGFDALYPLKPLLIAVALWRFRAVYRTWDWRGSWEAVAIGLVVFALWLALEPATGGESLAAAVEALPPTERSIWLALRIVGSVLCVPLAEELAFRGYLLRRLIAPQFEEVPFNRFTWLSFLVSSLAFGALHGRWVAGTLAGMAFAAAQYRHGRLADAVLAHLVANALIALAVLGFGRWSLWA